MRPSGLAGRAFAVAMDALNRPAHRAAAGWLAQRRPGDVLEIGFGTGQHLGLLAGRLPAARLAGLDPSPLMVATARRRLARFGPRVTVEEGDANALDGPPGRLDAAVALHSFQFWDRPADSLAALAAALRPGGVLLLVLRDHGASPPGWLPNTLSRTGDELRATAAALAAAGFSVAEPFALGGSPALAAAVPQA